MLAEQTEDYWDTSDIDSDVCPDDEAFKTLPIPPNQAIWSHGYTVRVNLKVEDPNAHLERIGWAPHSKHWTHCTLKYSERSILRGSTFLTQRSPQLKKRRALPMAAKNKELGTKLYTIEYDRTGTGAFLILRGVRMTDVEHFLEEHLGLEASQYELAYFLDLERFIVLDAAQAVQLAEALGGVPASGRGRLARKRYLLRDYEVPVRIRARTVRNAKVTIYRIQGGTTAQYKVEVALKGRRQDRGHFTLNDIPALDAVLQRFIAEHELEPRSKPERWEPTRPPQWRRDSRLARLPNKAYRGFKVPNADTRAAEACHTPCLRFCIKSVASSVASPSPPLIRKAERGGSHETTSAEPWNRVAKDLRRFPGYLTEVILGPDQDPEVLVKAIIESEDPGEVAVGVLGAELEDEVLSWSSMRSLMDRHPQNENTRTLVVVVDSSVWLAIEDAVRYCVRGSLSRTAPGPLLPPRWNPSWGDYLPAYVQATAALFTPLMEELRRSCESYGGRVVLITTDVRPDHGRGPYQWKHRFGDGRVRSHIGDAGRHWAHLRYLVEADDDGWPTWIGMLKDEGEGLPGRMLWGAHH